MNTIYLVRHGENTANLTGEFSCKHIDYSLTPKGILQAQQTAAFFKDKQIDEIYASPLKRTRETAAIIAQELALPVTVDEHFREVNVGSLELQPPIAENWELHNKIVFSWFAGQHELSFPEGENYVELLQRMREGLLEVTRGKESKNIVIVGHGGIFTFTIKGICTNVDIQELVRQGNHNCSVTTIELENSEGELVGLLKGWALCTHLSDEAAKFVPAMLPPQE